MSLLNQLGALGNSQSEYEYRRMMEMMAQQQYMSPSLSAAAPKAAEPSPVLLLLPRRGA